MRRTQLPAFAVLLAALAGGAMPSGASAQLPPGVEALVSAGAKGRVTRLVSPRLRTVTSHTVLLAFVIAGGATRGERVRGISGDGLRWSPVARSDGPSGAAEIWQARGKRWLSGPIVARLAAAAYPASITIVAYSGPSAYVAARAASQGRASTPRIKLRPAAGSLIWTVGLSQGQARPVLVSSVYPNRRVLVHSYDRRRRTGAWVALATTRSSAVASAAGASPSRSWNLAGVDVVVPGLKRLIEEGRLSAYGVARQASTAAGAALPAYCPPLPAFEVGVQDDPVFLGMQPAMSPTHGFELAERVFHARLLRLNMDWGEVKRNGWGPYDRAVAMARARCWAIHMTIMWTPTYAEGYLNSELSAHHLNARLLASFAAEIAVRYAAQVGRFSIGNEPNDGLFMALTHNLPTDLATYDRMYLAGHDAVKAADPTAQVIAGEVGGHYIPEWLANVARLPTDGVAVHAYSLTYRTSEFVRLVKPVPLLISEDGIPAADPHQLTRDLEREEQARQGGAKEFVFYQLSRGDATERWNTGIE